MNEKIVVPDHRLGRLPAKASRKALMFTDFVDFLNFPEKTQFWQTKKAFPLRSFGNLQYGSCTRSKQAVAIMRMERLEQRRTVEITDEEVIRVYTDMSNRLYGGGDNGAYEDDALSEWRNPELTIRDVNGRPYTIQAFMRLNPFNHRELKAAIALSGAHGIPVCLNLPAAWANVDPPADWDIPEGQAPIGNYLPGSWGGHSMWCFEYDEVGLWLDHTWMLPRQRVTWRAAAIYLDEAHVVIDDVNFWRKRQQAAGEMTGGTIDMKKLIAAVNDVSRIKIPT